MKLSEKTLEELGKVGRGKSRHRPRNAPHLYGGRYPFVQTGDVQAARFYINDYSQTYSEAGLAQSKLWPKDTLCISIVGANTAATAILGIDACFPDSVIGFLANKEVSDVRFVKYALEQLRDKLKGISEGTARENLSLEKLLTVKIPTPPLWYQKEIVSIIAPMDDLIDNNLKRIKVLEELAQRTYEEWFIKFRVNGEQLIINKDTGQPNGWAYKDLNTISEIVSGFPFKSSDYIINGPYKIVTIKNVQDGYFVPDVTDTLLQIPAKVKEEQKLKTEDIILSLTGNVGRSCLVHGSNYLLNQRVAKISPNRNSNKGFIYTFLRNKVTISNLENLSNGVAQQNLSPINMGLLKVVLPTQTLMDDFGKIADQIIELISKLNLINGLLKESRDILLPRLISGAIDLEAAREQTLAIAAEPLSKYNRS